MTQDAIINKHIAESRQRAEYWKGHPERYINKYKEKQKHELQVKALREKEERDELDNFATTLSVGAAICTATGVGAPLGVLLG